MALPQTDEITNEHRRCTTVGNIHVAAQLARETVGTMERQPTVHMFSPTDVETLEENVILDFFRGLRRESPELARLHEELHEIARLATGWHGPESSPPSSFAIRLSRQIAFDLKARSLPLPSAFPTPEGGVALEWTTSEVEASLIVDREAERGTFSVWNAETDNHKFEPDASFTPAQVCDWVSEFAPSR